MRGLGKWTKVQDKTQSALLKAQRKSSKGKFSLSKQELTSSSGEFAAVHFVQSDHTSFSDVTGESDNDPAVVSTVEILAASGSDVSGIQQEKEARSSGGILSQ